MVHKVNRREWMARGMIVASVPLVGKALAADEDPAASQRIQSVIDDVEEECLKSQVPMIGRRKAERLAELSAAGMQDYLTLVRSKYVYFAVQGVLHVPFSDVPAGAASAAYINVTERYKAKMP